MAIPGIEFDLVAKDDMPSTDAFVSFNTAVAAASEAISNAQWKAASAAVSNAQWISSTATWNNSTSNGYGAWGMGTTTAIPTLTWVGVTTAPSPMPDPMTSFPSFPDKSIAEVLRHAARIIEEFGWIQGGYGDERQGFCTMGAINFAAHGSSFGMSDLAMRTIGFLTLKGPRGMKDGIPTWNDRPRRTQAEVIHTLNQAADAWDATVTQRAMIATEA